MNRLQGLEKANDEAINKMVWNIINSGELLNAEEEGTLLATLEVRFDLENNEDISHLMAFNY